MALKNLICIVGPTAVGKTKIGISVARAFGTSIISADSRQFYKGMEIGTAAPTAEEQKSVDHYFVGFRDPKVHLNAGEFEIMALECLKELFSSKETALMVGGSGLFINAVTQGFDTLPSADEGIRLELDRIHKKEGIEVLREMLAQRDPEYLESVDQKNPRRLIRALEVIQQTGKKYSELRKGNSQNQRDFEVIKIGLNLARPELEARIDFRVEKMVKMGLVDEVRSLKAFKNEKALNSVGYNEMFEHLEGNLSLEEAIEKIKSNTRKFAKRQMTWFKRDKEIQWFPPDQEGEIIKLLQRRIGS